MYFSLFISTDGVYTGNCQEQFQCISTDGVAENCSCIFRTSHVHVGRILVVSGTISAYLHGWNGVAENRQERTQRIFHAHAVFIVHLEVIIAIQQ